MTELDKIENELLLTILRKELRIQDIRSYKYQTIKGLIEKFDIKPLEGDTNK